MAILETSTSVPTSESARSAVSWGAIFAGAVVASAVSLVLVLLGSGLGLAAVSPWSGNGATATTFAVGTVIWFVVIQWVASAFGGYVTGRLRTQWVGLHTDEVFFRDTAHGFVTWCLSTLLVAVLLSTAVTGILAKGVDSGTAVIAGAAQGASQGAVQSSGPADPNGYFVDLMFRPAAGQPASPANGSDFRGEASRILVSGLSTGEIVPADRDYLATLVASRTGLAQADATKRVDDVIAQVNAAREQAKEAADAARKVAMTTALLTVVAMLLGALIASTAAAYAGRLRDDDVSQLAIAVRA